MRKQSNVISQTFKTCDAVAPPPRENMAIQKDHLERLCTDIARCLRNRGVQSRMITGSVAEQPPFPDRCIDRTVYKATRGGYEIALVQTQLDCRGPNNQQNTSHVWYLFVRQYGKVQYSAHRTLAYTLSCVTETANGPERVEHREAEGSWIAQCTQNTQALRHAYRALRTNQRN